MIIGLSILFASYFIAIMILVYGYKKVAVFPPARPGISKKFSLIIPYRNEAENLPELLNSIAKLKYPKDLLEILFVNDASEDHSEAIIIAASEKIPFSIHCISNKRISNSPKKDAILEAIKNANHEWIITTDADCKLPQDWLKSLDAFIQHKNPVMVCGPVIYGGNNSFVEDFQQLDALSLQAVAIGSFGVGNPILSNGANFAYTKDAFFKVNGFVGNDHLASGDDVFLLEKMRAKFPGQVQFLKSAQAIVSTNPQKNWKNVINQRIRWASKVSKQNNFASMLLGVQVFLVNLILLILPFLLIFNFENWMVYTLLIIFKLATDFVFIWLSARFFDVKIQLWKFLLHTYIYAAISVIVVLGSFRGEYSWKGRSFNT
ncbi:glycosyltransferase family 2 protein [Aequorivita marina]|uniref:glycosyltransferase family 2 protein n=1 Tax=Aequorivita marina TaxID=3073654 RepID=UPI00287519D6|nr:glycosyltransferase [Aequorivita sp. S2608]MDS1299742.1 glycosyltransferase [Aequorivita sp. S2608]